MACTMYRRKCQLATCGQMHETRRPHQRFCSRRCAAFASPWRVMCGQRGGVVSARNRHTRALARLRAAFPGLSPAGVVALRADMKRSYEAGWVAGRRSGWAEACGERRDKSWIQVEWV